MSETWTLCARSMRNGNAAPSMRVGQVTLPALVPRDTLQNGTTLEPRRRPRTAKRPENTGRNAYRGAEIRTRDLTDPNGARYQAAPRPDAVGVFHTAMLAP